MLIIPKLDDSPVIDAVPRTPKEMLSVRDEAGRTVVRINSSSLSIIQECPRKAKYALKEKWKAEDESPATIFGSAIHKALEVYYTGDINDRTLPSWEDCERVAYETQEFDHAISQGLIMEALKAFARTAKPLATLPESDKRSVQNGIWILYEYFKAYRDDPWRAFVDDAGPFLERTFTYRIYESPTLVIDIFGTIDFVFQHTVTGELLAGDHKTSSFLNFGGSSYYDRDRPNHQYTMYMLGLRKVFGLNVENFAVNIVEVKARPKTVKAKGVSFPRQITKRTEEDFDELKDVIVDAVERYLYFNKKDFWPLGHVGACQSYGGCTYQQACSAPKSIRETILRNKFKQETT